MAEPVGHDVVDRISIDIEGLREPLEAVAAQEERNLNQMIRFLLKEGLAKISMRPNRNLKTLKPGLIEELDTTELAALATEIVAELERRAQASKTE
ncbi:hypothetical protein NDI52_33840 [Leptolyngbya sp. PL-A3]|uniref:hypothetical protein n=1 Tax=Leptolyngbya sp. PL-A3 TaxID=2933911 RepID=UPI003297A687